MVYEQFSTIDVQVSDDRIVAVLNRPEVRNAIDQTMVEELHALCADLEHSPRIMILAGSNGVFASGADISQLRERRRDDALAGINSTVFQRISRLPMPVIAALDGYALGGGAELAFAADFRIATPRLKIGNPEAGLGIIAGAGATWRLIELVGEPVAKEILLAGRILDAEQARTVHLVTEIHEPEQLMAGAHALADRIARQDPLAIRISKTVMQAPREAHPAIDTLAQGILFESQAKFDRMQAFLDRKSESRKEG
ncbi:MAG: enoyl-CoA hydratase [Micrococcales bacterium]|nr:MAG: enoyl-CoA hydratase [Micrococcales bacterium]